MLRMLSGVVTLALLLTSTVLDPQRSLAQLAVSQTCDITTSHESHSSPSGYYLLNGWNSGFIEVFQLTAISGTIYGNFSSISLLDDGTYETVAYPLSGAYDSEQISVVMQGFLESRVLTGTWDNDGLSLTAPSQQGQVQSFRMEAITEVAATELTYLWPQYAERQTAYDDLAFHLLRSSSSNVYKKSPFERVYSDAAASYLGIPDMSAIDLLLNGWLASAQFSDRDTGSDLLPNQANWYTAYTFSSSRAAHEVAGCWFERPSSQKADDYERLDGPLGSTIYLYQQTAEYGTFAYILAVHGSYVVTASLSGNEGVTEHGMEVVENIIKDLGPPSYT